MVEETSSDKSVKILHSKMLGISNKLQTFPIRAGSDIQTIHPKHNRHVLTTHLQRHQLDY